MSYDAVRFERGQVWRVELGAERVFGHEQNKDRPWLVLSVGRFNASSGMVTMVPITTRDSAVSPAQVLFHGFNGKRNVIECEQIRTFDYKRGPCRFTFMGVLSDEILEKVDVALSVHLGMHYSPITLNSLYDTMERIVKSIAHTSSKAAENSKKFTNEDVASFVAKMEEVYKESAGEETPEVEEEAADITEDTPKERTKRHRIQWTEEKALEFLSDCESLSKQEVISKWGIQSEKSVYNLKSYVKSLLEKWTAPNK